jgi:hypothetical protein
MPPEPFYPKELTDLSFNVLKEARQLLPGGLLIGGWGTWVRLRTMPSHDIDMIVSRADIDTIRPHVNDLSESTHVGGRKWRATLRGIHLDLYVPHQSRLGERLRLRVEDLVGLGEEVEGWSVLEPAAHLSTKFAALLDRPFTQPGRKDRTEVLALLTDTGVRPGEVADVLMTSSELPPNDLVTATRQIFGYIDEATTDRRVRDRLRSVQRECLESLRGSLLPAPAELSAAKKGQPVATEDVDVKPYRKSTGPVSGHKRRRPKR